MAMINCPECGENISDKATTCPNCGYPVLFATTKSETPSNVIPSQKKTPLALAIKIILVVHICSIVAIYLPGVISVLCALIAALLIPVDVILGIIYISKAKKAHTKKLLGTISLLSGIAIGAFFIITISTGINEGSTISNMDESEEAQYTAALYAMVNIRSHLKSPNSFVVNQVYVEVEDTRFTVNGKQVSDFVGFYHVYVDFSAENGLGGVGRKIASYTYNQDYDRFIPAGKGLDPIEIVSKIPQNGNLNKLDAQFFNNYDFSLLE